MRRFLKAIFEAIKWRCEGGDLMKTKMKKPVTKNSHHRVPIKSRLALKTKSKAPQKSEAAIEEVTVDKSK